MDETVTTLLVAIDPSPVSQSVFRQALRLAGSMRAKLLVVSVTPRYEGNMNRWSIAGANEQMDLPFVTCLAEAEEFANTHGQTVTTIHRVGDPVEEIVTLAEQEGAGLLLMGYQRRSYLKRVFLGQTAAKTIGMSPCDVLLVPENGEINFASILVGVDGSRYSMEAGQRALDLALSYGGEVHALTVLDVPLDRSLLYGVHDQARHKNFTALQVLAGQAEKLAVPIRTELREGSPYENIVKYSEEKRIQLIVLGAYGRTALARILMGSVVERVVALSHLPTLVVKRLADNGTRDQM